jgi:DNA-binding response OmpR family regulator
VVLVVEDDPHYRDLISLNLRQRGYGVLLAPDGLTGLNLLEQEAPDLVILDLKLPVLDGYEVCRRIREYSRVPIVMLTASATQTQKVHGLELGADDYVTKPFGADELLARVGAVLRRSQPTSELLAPPMFAYDGLVIDFTNRRVTVHGSEVYLTPHEYKILYDLALHAGRVLTKNELLLNVWGVGYEDQYEVLHTTVLRLRRKIEADPAVPRYVVTRRGIGYVLVDPHLPANAAER